MDWRAFAAAALLLAPALTLSGGPFTSLHPEEAYPDPEVSAEFDPFAGLVNGVEELDDPTLAERGVERTDQAAAGATSEPQAQR